MLANIFLLEIFGGCVYVMTELCLVLLTRYTFSLTTIMNMKNWLILTFRIRAGLLKNRPKSYVSL